MIKNNRMSCSLLFLVLAAALFPRIAAGASDYELLNPKFLYQIKDYPETGFFQYIVAAAVDEAEGAVYVIGGAPDAVSVYYRESGIPWRQTVLEDKLDRADRVCVCGGDLWLAHGSKLFKITDSGALASPYDSQPENEPPVQRILCDRKGRLLFVDRDNLEISRYDAEGKPDMKIAPPAEGEDKKNSFPLKSITAVATDYFNRIFVLDSKSRSIIPFSEAGRPMVAIKQDEFSDEPFPYDSPSIAIDSAKNIWMINDFSNTIDAYDPFGTLVKRIEQNSGVETRFVSPAQIFIDSDDRLYVVDNMNISVNVFDLRQSD